MGVHKHQSMPTHEVLQATRQVATHTLSCTHAHTHTHTHTHVATKRLGKRGEGCSVGGASLLPLDMRLTVGWWGRNITSMARSGGVCTSVALTGLRSSLPPLGGFSGRVRATIVQVRRWLVLAGCAWWTTLLAVFGVWFVRAFLLTVAVM